MRLKPNTTQLVFADRNRPLTTSVAVANQLGVKHIFYLRTINRYLQSKGIQGAGQHPGSGQSLIELEGQIFIPDLYKGRDGKEHFMWSMNELAFMKIMTLSQRYEKADAIVNLILKEFQWVREQLIQIKAQQQAPEWQLARSEGKKIRRQETDAIQEFVEYAKAQGSKSADKYYINITTMVNKAVFIVEQRHPNLRDVLDISQLMDLKVADKVVAKALRDGMAQELHYKKVFQLAKQRIEQWVELQGGKVLVLPTAMETASRKLIA